ncbi:MAG: hypothetical protein ACI9CF_000931 [Candidatus Omnitrophota bacterium]|jgi:hypothetical protein
MDRKRFEHKQGNLIKSLGVFVRKSQEVVNRVGRTFKSGAGKVGAKAKSAPREEVASSLADEIRAMLNERNTPNADLEKRLEMISEAVLQLQEQVAQSNTRQPMGEAQFQDAVDSISDEEGLDEEEKSVLETIFKQNLVLQGRT